MKKIFATLLVFTPFIASAQAITDVNSLTYKLTNIGNVVLEILIAFAVIYIVFQAVRFIMAGNDPEGRATIRDGILWGIVGLFVILSIWGLVKILTNTFRTDTAAPVNQYPQVQYPRQIP
jgi:heme/copper-type cytochrome/quinol oxidase subunit 4